MTEWNDKQARRQMVQCYMNAETSIEEEQQLADYYSTATEPLSEEEEEVWLLLQATTKGDGDFELSEDKVAEFDRLMASGVPVRHRRMAIAGWISAVAASIAVLFVLFGHHPEDKADEPQVAVVTPEEVKTEPAAEARPPAPIEQRKKPARRKSKPLEAAKDNSGKPEGDAANGEIVSTMMAAANVMDEQVETYCIQPVGDATIVTKTFVDGTSSSCIVCSMDGGSGYSVIPL